MNSGRQRSARAHASARSHVVIATRIYTPEPAAASFRLRALAHALAGVGERVRVLTTTFTSEAARRSEAGVAVSRWPVLRNKDGYVRGYLGYLSFDLPLIGRLLATPRLRAVVAEPPPTTGAVVRLVCALRRVPYVYYAADVWSDATLAMGVPSLVTRVLRRVEAFAMGGAARVIAVSDGVAERVQAISGRNAHVVPNGINVDTYQPRERPAAVREVLGDAPFLIYAGTASEWQGADIFLESWPEVERQHPDLHLVFLGSGSQWSTIEEGARSASRVHVLPKVPEEAAAGWVASAEAALVAVIPGVGYDFAYPTKILAALACGTPVLFAGVGPARDDIEAHALGVATEHTVEAVAEGMAAIAGGSHDPAHLREWVVAHRSSEASALRAAGVVIDAANRT